MNQQTPNLDKTQFYTTTSNLAEIKKYFDDNGYVVVRNVFSRPDLAPIQARLDEIIADPTVAPEGVKVGHENDTLADNIGGNSENPVRNITGLVRFDPLFQQFACNPKLLELVHTLIGSKVKVFRDQALQKPPGGQAKPVHQDLSYFRVQPADELVTAWVAVEEATTKNGCMVYVPGSHKHGLFEITTDPQRPVHHMPNTRGLALAGEVFCPVDAGSVIFHHSYTLHRSGVNATNTWRRSVQLHYASCEARSDNEQLNQEVSLEID